MKFFPNSFSRRQTIRSIFLLEKIVLVQPVDLRECL